MADEEKKVGFIKRVKEKVGEAKKGYSQWVAKKKYEYDKKLQERGEQSDRDIAMLEKRREWYKSIEKEKRLRQKIKQKKRETSYSHTLVSMIPSRKDIGAGSRRIESHFGLGKPKLVKKRVGRKVYYYDTGTPVHQREQPSLLDATGNMLENKRDRGKKGKFVEEYDILPTPSNFGFKEHKSKHTKRDKKGKYAKRKRDDDMFKTSGMIRF